MGETEAAAGSCGGVLFDHARAVRTGLPEAVFCEGKDDHVLCSLLESFAAPDAQPVLFTRLAPDRFGSVPEAVRASYDYDGLSRTAFNACLPARVGCSVAVVSAGTADASVAWEAQRTLAYLGFATRMFQDCGVAGLWRLTGSLDEIAASDVIIVAAGLEGALPSVLGGLTGRPIFAVPTSVGYGVAAGGKTALAAMLASCSPGIAVLNVDNGYGAACAAARVLNLILESRGATA